MQLISSIEESARALRRIRRDGAFQENVQRTHVHMDEGAHNAKEGEDGQHVCRNVVLGEVHLEEGSVQMDEGGNDTKSNHNATVEGDGILGDADPQSEQSNNVEVPASAMVLTPVVIKDPVLTIRQILSSQDTSRCLEIEPLSSSVVQIMPSGVRRVKERAGNRRKERALKSPYEPLQHPKNRRGGKGYAAYKKGGKRKLPKCFLLLDEEKVAYESIWYGENSRATGCPPLAALRELCTQNKKTGDEAIAAYGDLIIARSRRESHPSIYCFHPLLTVMREKIDLNPKLYLDQFHLNFEPAIDFSQYELLFFPSIISKHWFLIIGDALLQKWVYINSLPSPHYKEEAKKIIDDAIGEFKVVKFEAPQFWKFEEVLDAPRQTNGKDCGIFTMLFMERYSRRAPNDFSSDNINFYR